MPGTPRPTVLPPASATVLAVDPVETQGYVSTSEQWGCWHHGPRLRLTVPGLAAVCHVSLHRHAHTCVSAPRGAGATLGRHRS